MRKFITGLLLVCMFSSLLAIAPGTVFAATPTTTVSLTGPSHGTGPTYVNALTNFVMDATEPGGGTVTTWYWWVYDSTTYDPVEYDGAFGPSVIVETPGAPALPIDIEGAATLHYNSSDDSGNHETPKSLDIFVDDYGPTSSISFTGSYEDGSHTYLNTTSEISFTATDSGSGLKDIWYKIDQGFYINYTGSFSIGTSGSHTIYYFAEDNLENAEDEKSITVYVDSEAPVVTISTGSPSTEDYISSATQILISAADDGSGIQTIYYKVDTEFWEVYSTPIQFSTEGPHTVRAYAVDFIGNPSEPILFGTDVDITPPEITLTGAVDGIIEVDKGDSLVFVTSDEGVGQNTVFYSLDNGLTWQEYAGLSIQEDMTITYYAQDALGNFGQEYIVEVKVSAASMDSTYLIIGFSLAAIGIVFLIYINWPGKGGSEDKSKDSTKDKKKSNEPDKKKKARKRN